MYAIHRARAECKPVRQWLEERNAVEISEEIAYDQIENSDEWVQNSRLCAVIANTVSSKKKFETKDFLPVKPKQGGTLAEKLKMLAQAFSTAPKVKANSFNKMKG